jgi:hypothetical protein
MGVQRKRMSESEQPSPFRFHVIFHNNVEGASFSSSVIKEVSLIFSFFSVQQIVEFSPIYKFSLDISMYEILWGRSLDTSGEENF